jgi:hypothetical protein
MQPAALRKESFAKYPPQAHSLAVEYLAALRTLPLSLLPLLLAELQEYDRSFPAERASVLAQLQFLQHGSPDVLQAALAGCRSIRLPKQLAAEDWVNAPREYAQQLSAALWATQQMDAFRAAAKKYQAAWQATSPPPSPVCPRLAIAIVGQGAKRAPEDVFKRLKPHGCLFTAVQPEGGFGQALDHLRRRAARYPVEYGHWYIEGGASAEGYGREAGIIPTSYVKLAPVAHREMQRVAAYVRSAQSQQIGPEQVRSYMANLTARELDLQKIEPDPVMQHFNASILTEGSGTQIFSTSFVQWAARESLRRAQPVTLLTHDAPRQQNASMNQLLTRDPLKQPVDAAGSLVDGEMGAYYTWLNLQRLPGAQQPRFIAWYEDHSVALAISPELPRNTVSTNPLSLRQILDLM